MIRLRYTGRFSEMSDSDRRVLFNRTTSADAEIRGTVASIIEDVRLRGDVALASLAARFDPVVPETLEIPRPMCQRALEDLSPELRRAMERAADNIDSVHRASLPRSITTSPEPGICITRRPDPLARVGVYAPGGRAAYPSSVLMGAIPARVAGVGEIILCSPPGVSGRPPDVVLAAAELSGVDRVFAIGGAGAIAAMALGTQCVPRVDRIVGPGNAYVTEAKLQLVGSVGIDSPAGPSELVVIADETADPRVVAIEMLAQAEHDPRACAVALCIGDAIADDVTRELNASLPAQPRGQICARALGDAGGVISVTSRREAVDIANRYSPEHLLVMTDAPAVIAEAIRGAGTVFIGKTSSVVFGDYITGANHVLPTGGLARAYSGLSVLDFLRWTTLQEVDSSAAAALAADTVLLADSENLPGHAFAAQQWSRS